MGWFESWRLRRESVLGVVVLLVRGDKRGNRQLSRGLAAVSAYHPDNLPGRGVV